MEWILLAIAGVVGVLAFLAGLEVLNPKVVDYDRVSARLKQDLW